jgi:hypothetical protein
LRFFPAGLPVGRLPPDFHPTDEDLSVGAPGLTLWLGLAELPGLGLEREPEAGLPGLELDLGFQPGPALAKAPGLLLGRAPPARGLPLLVV